MNIVISIAIVIIMMLKTMIMFMMRQMAPVNTEKLLQRVNWIAALKL